MSRERFEIVRTDAGWHARLLGANGETVLSSEVYTRREAAVDAVMLAGRVAHSAAFATDPGVQEVDERSG